VAGSAFRLARTFLPFLRRRPPMRSAPCRRSAGLAKDADALTAPAPPSPDIPASAQRLSDASGSQVDLPVAFASYNTAVQRVGQLAKNTRSSATRSPMQLGT
jgi:hypothetical protein